MVPLLLILASKLLGNVPAPEIEFGEWLPTDSFSYAGYADAPVVAVKDQKTNATIQNAFSVPANVAALVLTCNASYPIQWEFDFEEWGRKAEARIQVNKLVRSKRKVTDMFSESTFQYISELRLSSTENTPTGNYTCRSSTDPEVSTTLYLFWHGNSPPYLLHSGKNKTVYLKEDKDSNWPDIILPCHVAVPEVKILLQKKREVITTEHVPKKLIKNASMNTTTDTIQTTSILWDDFDPNRNNFEFDPRRGFMVKSPNQDVLGTYKCFVDNDPTDFVYIDVVHQEAPKEPEFREMLNNNASFTYSDLEKKFICCSETWKPPTMQLTSCEHPTLCAVQKKTLNQVRNLGHRIYGTSCVSIPLVFESSGIVRCSGDGVAIFREYFFAQSVGLYMIYMAKHISRKNPLKDDSGDKKIKLQRPIFITGEPYYRWTDADPHKMVSVMAKTTEMYDGQTTSFYCQASPFYFAEGIKWSIEWNNRTRLVSNGDEASDFVLSILFIRPGYSTLKTVVDVNMTTVTCFAPVWNSSKWFDNSIQLNVKVPELPTIDHSEDDNISVNLLWYLNDTGKTLECFVRGDPAPKVVWTHNNKTINETRRVNGTSYLSINLVQHSDSGVYSCVADNFAGDATKTFHVQVQERTSTTFVVGVTFASLFGVAILIALGLLSRRLWTQSIAINHLKNVAFKDVTDTNQRHNNDYGFNGISSIIPTPSFQSQHHGSSNGTNGTTTITSHQQQHHDSTNNNIQGFRSQELRAPDNSNSNSNAVEEAEEVEQEDESPPARLIAGRYHKF